MSNSIQSHLKRVSSVFLHYFSFFFNDLDISLLQLLKEGKEMKSAGDKEIRIP